VAASVASGPAHAEAQVEAASAPSIALAQTIYDQARKLMTAGDFPAACPLFAQSYSIDPQLGPIMNLAFCFEGDGRYASAWTIWLEAVREAEARGQDERAAFAKNRAEQIEDKVRRVTVRVDAQPAGAPIRVTLDRAPVDRARWGTPIPVDDGLHEVAATGDGMRSWSTTFRVGPGQVPDVVVPGLAVVPRVMKVVESPSIPERVSSPLRPVAWTVGGLGLAALGVGAAFGIVGLVAENASTQNQNCVRGGCNATGMSDVSRAQEDLRAADVSYAIGAGLLVAAGVLWFASRDKPAESTKTARIVVSPAVERGSWSFVVDGAW
jgi:hypothetical protein